MAKNFQEIELPSPGTYEDWRSWAASLIRALTEFPGEGVHNFPLWVRDENKARDGLPIGADGDLIRVLDTDSVIRFYWWSETDGSWHNINSEV